MASQDVLSCPFCESNNGGYQLRWTPESRNHRYEVHDGTFILVCCNCDVGIEFDGRTEFGKFAEAIDAEPYEGFTVHVNPTDVPVDAWGRERGK